jgi:hypothetical protein
MSRTTRLTSRSSPIMRAGDLLEQVVGQAGPIRGHRIVGGDRAQDDDVAVGALVALDPDGAHVGQDAEGLPQLPVQAGLADLVLEDRVRVAQEVQALLRGLAAHDADRQARAGERLAPDEALGSPSSAPDGADLVLEQRPQRLDELEVQVVGQPADVVVGLDRRRARAAARLDDVGVERPLDEELRALLALGELERLLLEDPDELRPMILRLASGSETPRSLSRKRSSASTATRGTWKWSRNVRTTCSPSFLRIIPWSTKTHVSWSPIARWTSSAATEESTPPERPQMTFLSPTCARMRSSCSSTMEPALHVRSHAQTSPRNVLRTSWPNGVWTTSGWYWMP